MIGIPPQMSAANQIPCAIIGCPMKKKSAPTTMAQKVNRGMIISTPYYLIVNQSNLVYTPRPFRRLCMVSAIQGLANGLTFVETRRQEDSIRAGENLTMMAFYQFILSLKTVQLVDG